GLMWLVDLVLTMPSLLLLIVLATIFPPSILTIPLVIGAIGWTTFARTVRGDVLSLRERDYVQAALALGASDARIILRHLLPGGLATACAVPLDPPPSGAPDGDEPPRAGGVLREASSEDPRYLDPAKGYDTVSWGLEQMLFNTLVAYDAGTTIVPELAESWTLSPDGRHVSFALRHDVVFSTGRPMTAADVKYSLERLLRPTMHS